VGEEDERDPLGDVTLVPLQVIVLVYFGHVGFICSAVTLRELAFYLFVGLSLMTHVISLPVSVRPL